MGLDAMSRREAFDAALYAVWDWFLNRGCSYAGRATPVYLAVQAALTQSTEGRI